MHDQYCYNMEKEFDFEKAKNQMLYEIANHWFEEGNKASSHNKENTDWYYSRAVEALKAINGR